MTLDKLTNAVKPLDEINKTNELVEQVNRGLTSEQYGTIVIEVEE